MATNASSVKLNAVGEASYPPTALAWAMVGLLSLGYIFSFVDRMIIGLLVEPIKADLNISDTEFSLLVGLAFALFYTIAGIPIGRIIDRSKRLRIIAFGVALWSLMTAVCALASSFWHLFAARMGVGIGEATLSPAAYSVISDSFPRTRLGLAMGIYGLGAAIGAGMAFIVGAIIIGIVADSQSLNVPLIGELRIWQAAFLIVGLPGLMLAGVFFILPEPHRRGTLPKSTAKHVPLAEVFAFIKNNAKLLGYTVLAASVINLGLQGAVAWLPAVLMRSHGMDIVTAGYTAGSALIVGGLAGLIGGGLIADRFSAGAASGRVQLSRMATAIGAPCGLVFPLASDPVVLWIFFTIFFAAAAVTVGTVPTILQQIVPNRMRATISAGYLFAISMIGLALGPTLTALLGDIVFPFESGIGHALALICPLSYLCGVVCYSLSIRAFAKHAGLGHDNGAFQ